MNSSTDIRAFFQNPPPKTVNHRVHRVFLCVLNAFKKKKQNWTVTKECTEKKVR